MVGDTTDRLDDREYIVHHISDTATREGVLYTKAVLRR